MPSSHPNLPFPAGIRRARNQPETSARNLLAEQHFGLVWWVARKLKLRLAPGVELDDLVGDGALGLLRAAQRYDAGRQIPFQRFAVRYIRGAMLDGLRRRTGSRKQTDPPPVLVRLDLLVKELLDDRNVPRVDLKDEVESILRKLTPRQRQIMRLRYLEGHTQREIGLHLGISEARTSKLVTRTIRQIRAGAAAALRCAA